jgi:peptide/nickel transport system substrate-binding protein
VHHGSSRPAAWRGRCLGQRGRPPREPPEKGGWSSFFTCRIRLHLINPGVGQPIRGNGRDGWWGWSDAADLPKQQAIAREMQQTAFKAAPPLPLSQYFRPTAYRCSLTDVPKAMPLFRGLRKTA